MQLNEHCAIEEGERGSVRLTITEAGRANVLGTPVIEGLLDGLGQLVGRPDLRALVVTGSGERTFVGGADIGEMVHLDRTGAERFIMRLRDLCDAVRRFPAPVVARIAGWCLGGGLEFAIACDLRVAARSAQFAMPEVRVGIPSVIHAALLPRLVGAGRARRMILTGDAIDADTALAWGLVDVVAEPEDLDTAVARILDPILSCGPEVIRSQKVLMRQWDELSLDAALAASVPVFGRAFETGEPQRYMQHFLDAKTARRAAQPGEPA